MRIIIVRAAGLAAAACVGLAPRAAAAAPPQAPAIEALAETDSYACVARQRIGFKFFKDTREWTPSLSRGTAQYSLKRQGAKWTWYGGDKRALRCGKRDARDVFECGNALVSVLVNERTLRFTHSIRRGFVEYPDPAMEEAEGSVEPMMEIGDCTRSEFEE